MLLLMARHGETAANREKRFQGQRDYPLNAKGEQQAGCLVAALKPYPLQAVFTSDLTRASRTAAVAAGSLSVPIHAHPFFREYSFGIAEGLTPAEVKTLYPRWGEKLRHIGVESLPGAEEVACFSRRLVWSWHFFSRFPGECCLLVSHGRFINAFLTLLITGRERPPYPFPVRNASLSAVSIKKEHATLLFHNDTCHLEKG